MLHELPVSERRACRVLGQPRSTQRRVLVRRDDEGALTRAIIDLATEYGCDGYRRVTAPLRQQGWQVDHKRVERIWRREGLKVPQKQPKRGRLWLNDRSCVRRRPQHRHHVWSYDFVIDRTHDGRAFRMLTVIAKYSRECLPAAEGRVASAIRQTATPGAARQCAASGQAYPVEPLSLAA